VRTTTTPAVDRSTNRFTSSSFIYDRNGNITADIDPVTSQARSFVFNGDNKQVEVKNASGAAIGKYYYDGEGKRVKKVTQIETTIFVYSGGKLAEEYSTATPPSNPTISYTTTDHLGSPRVITDKYGAVKSRRDFMPFGEDIYVGVGGRTGDTGQKYASTQDDVRQKFTGYQKDRETSLDFAEARMYENRFGRFTAVDPLMASGRSVNPQTFNRYLYTSNNPVSRADRNGKDWIVLEELREIKGKTFLTRTPTWVAPEETPDIAERVSGIWAIDGAEGGGFQVFHPDRQLSSQVYATWEEAQAKYNEWMTAAILNDFGAEGVQGAANVTNGVSKGIGNLFINNWNSNTQLFGLGGHLVGIPNPIAIERFTGSNWTEAMYMNAGETGPMIGVAFAAGPFSAARAPSVVPDTILSPPNSPEH
jgi:RHS repeat-associated protein